MGGAVPFSGNTPLNTPHKVIVHVRGNVAPVYIGTDGEPHTCGVYSSIAILFQHDFLYC
jgi:hypothetical protein